MLTVTTHLYPPVLTSVGLCWASYIYPSMVVISATSNRRWTFDRPSSVSQSASKSGTCAISSLCVIVCVAFHFTWLAQFPTTDSFEVLIFEWFKVNIGKRIALDPGDLYLNIFAGCQQNVAMEWRGLCCDIASLFTLLSLDWSAHDSRWVRLLKWYRFQSSPVEYIIWFDNIQIYKILYYTYVRVCVCVWICGVYIQYIFLRCKGFVISQFLRKVLACLVRWK